MGAPVANRQQAADRVVEVKSENPVPPPVVNAHTMPLQPGENLTQWTDRYVAALNQCYGPKEYAALKDGNSMLLGKVLSSHAEQAKPSQEKLRKADAEARKRVTEVRPRPDAEIPNPEPFVKDMFTRIDQAETPEAVDAIYKRDIWPFESQLLPPDMQALLQRMRHRKAALEPDATRSRKPLVL